MDGSFLGLELLEQLHIKKITLLISYFVVVPYVLLLYAKFETVGYSEITDARLIETIENCV